MEKTVSEVSVDTGITQQGLIKAIKEGRLPGRRAGHIWLIDVKSPKYSYFLQEHQKWLEARGKGTRDTED